MTGIIKVDTIQNNGGTTGLTIDSSGRVTRNVVPAFRIGRTSDQSSTTTGSEVTVLFDDFDSDNCFIQGGMSLSSGVVTAPIAGLYQFNMNLRINNIGSGFIIGKIVINNEVSNNKEVYIIDGNPASDYTNLPGSEVFKLQANDNVRFQIYSQADNNYNISLNSSASGVFIG